MPGPFPGMDPYLENYWGDVHARLIVLASMQLRPRLPGDLRARIEEQVTVSVEDENVVDYQPDVRVVERSETSAETADAAGGVAVQVESSGKVIVPLRGEPLTERSIHIVDRSSGNRVVTTIEFVSPWNKLGRRQQERFRRKQDDLIAGGVNVVEIDLIRRGGWVLSAPPDDVPQTAAYPYRICVLRAASPRKAECCLTSLQKPLPGIDIPLRPTDDDPRLDLQELIDQVREDGDYRDLVYPRETMPRFSPEDEEWIRQCTGQ